MDTFAQIAQRVVAPHAEPHDIENAVLILGPEAQLSADATPPSRRAELVDRFIRNLRTLSVRPATPVQRKLLAAVNVSPEGEWHAPLAGPLSVIELRAELKLALTVIGLDWELLTRLQSSICSLARWIQGNGGGTARVELGNGKVRCTFVTRVHAAEPELVERSPMVSSLRSLVAGLRVEPEGLGEMRIEFSVPA